MEDPGIGGNCICVLLRIDRLEMVGAVANEGDGIADGVGDCSAGNCKLGSKSGDVDSGIIGVHGGEISIELS